jgi:hypothetical protein
LQLRSLDRFLPLQDRTRQILRRRAELVEDRFVNGDAG